METRANYVVTGAFTLAVIAGVFSFIFWFHNSGSGGERASYRVVFTGSGSGLRRGGSVFFHGIRLAEVALPGGAPDAALLASDDGTPPTLYAAAGAGADVTQAARDVLSRISGLVVDNEAALRSSLRNIETVTSTLAQNSERLDKVMAGLENLTGSGDKSGEIAQAAEAVRKLAENLDKRTDEISVGLTRFSNSGLKEFEAFAVDGRRTLAELNKAIKNIDQHPSRLIFGQ